MTSPKQAILPRSGVVFPAIGAAFYAATVGFGLGGNSALTLPGAAFLCAVVVVMFGTVFATVHHAEAIAHRIGEPYGTLVLTLAVTVIEAALIVTMMLGGSGNATVARDTVFCVIMIVCNGLVGLCILIGGLRHREQEFLVHGANSYLSVIATLAALTLMLPNYTTTIPGPVFSVSQLVFVSIVTLVLYGVFLYIQTVRHTEYFTTTGAHSDASSAHPQSPQQPPREEPAGLAGSSALLVVSLVVVILLAKKFGVGIDEVLDRAGAPVAVSGLIVALLVLLPESMAAARAAYQDDLQKSLNLALGSSLATIGLTIPAVAAAAVLLDKTLVLGLAPKETLLLALTMIVSVLTFGTGRTNVLPGLIHAVIFAAFIFLTFVP
ncbi:MAG TPA: ionic transporter y4hA [Burkholderiaceae bacterium]|nr:ionic transporter y4hA [Burkholderiaceae bacterium]